MLLNPPNPKLQTPNSIRGMETGVATRLWTRTWERKMDSTALQTWKTLSCAVLAPGTCRGRDLGPMFCPLSCSTPSLLPSASASFPSARKPEHKPAEAVTLVFYWETHPLPTTVHIEPLEKASAIIFVQDHLLRGPPDIENACVYARLAERKNAAQ